MVGRQISDPCRAFALSPGWGSSELYPVKFGRLDWNLYARNAPCPNHQSPGFTGRTHAVWIALLHLLSSNRRWDEKKSRIGCRTRHPAVFLLVGWWGHSMILQRALQRLETGSTAVGEKERRKGEQHGRDCLSGSST